MANPAVATLTLKQVERLEEKNPNMFWDGWTLVVVNTKKDGYQDKNGIYFNGKWSVQHRIKLTEKGRYNVPRRYLRASK